ncbi:MAG: Dyp-type peroxidase [Anaerorhabdus sp.]|uniref:Dyp-type peroxidase n=1 Tax=Anaerorhabdus sp. TaxID=1872524 RepID=UPI002FCA506C
MKYQDVIPEQAQSTILCTVNFRKDVDTEVVLEAFKGFCERLHPTMNSMKIRFPYDNFKFAMGIGAEAWQRLFPNTKRPKELERFNEINGQTKKAVSTEGDLFFHIRAEKMDVCYEMMLIIHKLLKDVIESVDETHGFRFRDGRAIFGFVDGTENPDMEEVQDVVYIDDENDPYIGGTYVLAQKYIFDLDLWDSLTVEKQELVVGRTKENDLELADDVKPSNAHTEISKAHDKMGEEIKIMRANIAFAEASKNLFGSYFLGYSKDFSTTLQMLQHMFEGKEKDTHDSILDYFNPITGNLFFVPSYEQLDMIANDEIK